MRLDMNLLTHNTVKERYKGTLGNVKNNPGDVTIVMVSTFPYPVLNSSLLPGDNQYVDGNSLGMETTLLGKDGTLIKVTTTNFPLCNSDDLHFVGVSLKSKTLFRKGASKRTKTDRFSSGKMLVFLYLFLVMTGPVSVASFSIRPVQKHKTCRTAQCLKGGSMQTKTDHLSCGDDQYVNGNSLGTVPPLFGKDGSTQTKNYRPSFSDEQYHGNKALVTGSKTGRGFFGIRLGPDGGSRSNSSLEKSVQAHIRWLIVMLVYVKSKLDEMLQVTDPSHISGRFILQNININTKDFSLVPVQEEMIPAISPLELMTPQCFLLELSSSNMSQSFQFDLPRSSMVYFPEDVALAKVPLALLPTLFLEIEKLFKYLIVLLLNCFLGVVLFSRAQVNNDVESGDGDDIARPIDFGGNPEGETALEESDPDPVPVLEEPSLEPEPVLEEPIPDPEPVLEAPAPPLQSRRRRGRKPKPVLRRPVTRSMTRPRCSVRIAAMPRISYIGMC